MKGAYYNEIDPFAAAWIRELIRGGYIAPGEVDERSVLDVHPLDLRGFAQCHFFAGIGVWSLALRQAGWPDDLPVWTGSCPCQPFSSAGKGAGFADERHVWPYWFHLIWHERPVRLYGEQVASKDGLSWIDLVQADLEGEGYAFGAVDTCAAGFGAPHIRQRLYFVADSEGGRVWAGLRHNQPEKFRWIQPSDSSAIHSVADSDQLQQWEGGGSGGEESAQPEERSRASGCSGADGLAHTPGLRLQGVSIPRAGNGALGGAEKRQEPARGRGPKPHGAKRPGPVNGLWADADWLFCRDGRLRAVEPGTFPLVDGTPARVGRIRGYGNAVNLAQCQGFIEATL